MPIDLSSWRAGIANVNHKIYNPTKVSSYGSLASYVFPIIWLFWYVYFFLAISIMTFPLSVCITTIFASAPDLGHLVSHVLFNSLLFNFATLTIYAQSFICLLKFLSKYVCFVVRDQVVSTISFIIHEIHHSRKNISNLFRFFLIFWVSLSLLNQFPNDNIGKIKILMAGDIHPHPGQVDVGLKFCHWNLNGIIARDRIKIPLIEAYNSIFHYDIIALSETIINNSVPDEDIFIEGFSKEIFRSDHPSGDKKGGVCIYFKENLPIKRRKDLESMQETVVTEITLRRKKIFFVAIYRSPNQSSEEFDLFQESLQNIIDSIKDLRPHCIALTGDFNCRSNQWWPGDKNLPEGIALDDLFESYNMTQLIDQPTNIEPRGISCVDLIVTNQPKDLLS